MKKLKTLTVLFGLITVLISCTNKNEDDLTPTQSNLTNNNPTYNNKISAVMSANCTTCHNSSPSSSSIPLDTYESAKLAIQNNSLICRISSNDCGDLMPQGGSKLPQSVIDDIVKWQTNNFPQN